MASFNQSIGKFIKDHRWSFEHLFFPALIVLLGITLNNFYQAKRQPNLIAYAKDHQIMKISEDRFKIKCPFTIVNNGGSSTKNKKLTLLIPPSLTIDEIVISAEYRSFYNKSDGGRGYSYIVYSVDLPKGKDIEGTIVFYSNVEIPEKGMCPLNIIH